MTALLEEKRAALAHLAWFAAGLVGAFLIPFIFTTLLDLQHDICYLLYFALALSFLYAYVRWSGASVLDLFRRNWRWSLGLGVIAAASVVMNVLNRDATPRPSGPYFAFEFFWRGGIYGAVDALFLTAFPSLVAFKLIGGYLSGILRKAGYVVLAACLIAILTGVYHFGYEQFREDGIGGPEIGNMVISVPVLATLNPAGSVIAHVSMHVAAEAHPHETDLFLPPQQEVD